MLELQIYPSEILLKPTEPITTFDQGLIELCDSMVSLMFEKQGLGLAAPQVNIGKSVFVMRRRNGEILIAVNPEVSASGELVPHTEGCLSLPQIFEQVVRPRLVTLRYQEPSTGALHSVELSDYDAFCAQHEADHLQGVMFIDRLASRQMKKAVLRAWEREKRKIFPKK